MFGSVATVLWFPVYTIFKSRQVQNHLIWLWCSDCIALPWHRNSRHNANVWNP